MTSKELKRLNSYPEFRSILGVNSVKAYINSANAVPGIPLVYPALNTRQRNRFRAKFPVNDWEVHQNTLFYRPIPIGGPAPAVQRINF